MGRFTGLARRIAYNNLRGLPEIYNAALCESTAEVLVFVHDDVWIEDLYFVDRVLDGLGAFDIIGLAGNRRRVPHQVVWIEDENGEWDRRYISGAVAHGPEALAPVTDYGPCPAECEVLDGLFLAVLRGPLVAKGVFFDPAFDFHFYDLDFCRTARLAGLRLGTWPISVTHSGKGLYGSEGWERNRVLYERKWAASPSAEA